MNLPKSFGADADAQCPISCEPTHFLSGQLEVDDSMLYYENKKKLFEKWTPRKSSFWLNFVPRLRSQHRFCFTNRKYFAYLRRDLTKHQHHPSRPPTRSVRSRVQVDTDNNIITVWCFSSPCHPERVLPRRRHSTGRPSTETRTWSN